MSTYPLISDRPIQAFATLHDAQETALELESSEDMDWIYTAMRSPDSLNPPYFYCIAVNERDGSFVAYW